MCGNYQKEADGAGRCGVAAGRKRQRSPNNGPGLLQSRLKKGTLGRSQRSFEKLTKTESEFTFEEQRFKGHRGTPNILATNSTFNLLSYL